VSEATSRVEQKERTREALLSAALRLSQANGFAQVSLRNVTKEAGVVPTAFYRHFASMDELGLALVAQCFGTLRAMIRDAQRDPDIFADLVPRSVDILVEAVKSNREHFAFVARERLGGSEVVREAIQRELQQFISELAVAISPLGVFSGWASDDVMALSGLYVRNLVYRAERVIALPEGRADLEKELKVKARRELRMIALGIENWESRR
jgi:AcrR family transcriptional regulator